LLVHHALRQLAHLAARSRDVDPDRISFTRTLPAARRAVPVQAGFSPGRLARALDRTLAEITRRLLPQRRPRSYPRVARRKMSHWHLKRPEHRHRRHPSSPTPETITITPASRTTSKAKRKLPQGT
ncbi:hypothetical protein AB0L67_41375, partial [Streptomyces flaveolus]